MTRRGLRARLGRVFAAPVTVIGLATLVGVYVTRVVVEDLLTRRALDLEAEHYWQLADADPAQPLPNTANLRGYLDALLLARGEMVTVWPHDSGNAPVVSASSR